MREAVRKDNVMIMEALTLAGRQRDDVQIKVEGVQKRFGSAEDTVTALKDINLEISDGEFVCLLGPSGCGKSTLLNAIAGFSPPTEGRIIVEGKDVVAPGPDRGMVFQEYALFPWMTVRQNIAFGLEIQKCSLADIDERTETLMHKLKLQDFKDRFPKDLSGGMRQRVAIARILALNSPIMLMDEPFGALDALTRRSLQDELLRIWAELKKTIIFVTHSIDESIYLADRIIVMTYRPGTVKADVRVEIERPRDSTRAEFNDLKKYLTSLVMKEQERFAEDEGKLAGLRG